MLMRDLRYDRLFTDQPVDPKGDMPLRPGCAYVLDGRIVRLVRVEADSIAVEDPVTCQEQSVKAGQLSVPPQPRRQYRRTDQASKAELKRAISLRDCVQEAFALPANERTDEKLNSFGENFGIGARRFRDLMTDWLSNPNLSTLIRQRRGPKIDSKRCSKDVEAVLDLVVLWARRPPDFE